MDNIMMGSDVETCGDHVDTNKRTVARCQHCLHMGVCVYLWEFTFPNTDNRKQPRECWDNKMGAIEISCGHFLLRRKV